MLKQILKSFWPGHAVESNFPKSELPFTVCRVRRPDGPAGFVDILTLLPPEAFVRTGIAHEAIVGYFTKLVAEGEEGERIDPAIFRPNKAFVDLLHDVITTNAPEVPELQSAARQQHTGWLYILDARTRTPAGDVPLRDIIGAFEVREGVIAPNSYWANSDHLLFSSDGIFKLSSTSLQKALMERLIKATTHRG